MLDDYNELNAHHDANIAQRTKIARDMLNPEWNVYKKVQKSLEGVPIPPESTVTAALFRFFAVFNAGNSLEDNETIDDKVLIALVNYLNECVDEASFVLKSKKDIENLESVVIKLHSKQNSAVHSRSNSFSMVSSNAFAAINDFSTTPKNVKGSETSS